MAKFALIGNPIGHSLSPALFRAAYGEAAPDTYVLMEYPDAEHALRALVDGGYRGANVTAPFKGDVMRFATVADRASRILGAANLLMFDEKGISAYNTDYLGVKAIAERERAFCNGSAIVVGTGGAGKAAALAAKDAGYDTMIANRSVEKAVEFARKTGVTPIPLTALQESIKPGCLLIYTLPLAIAQAEGCRDKEITILEANYRNPALSGRCEGGSGTAGTAVTFGTPGKQEERKGRCRYVGGTEWLIAQAVPGFRIFTGREPDEVAMRRIAELVK